MARTNRAQRPLEAFNAHDAKVRAWAQRMLVRAAVERADDSAVERERAHCARRDRKGR